MFNADLVNGQKYWIKTTTVASEIIYGIINPKGFFII